MPTPTERFSDRVENYVRYRPAYPAAFYEMLRTELSLTPDQPVADVGSGTGISAAPLLATGHVVHCVEPNAPMRAAAERLLMSYPGFRSVAGTAECTTLPGASVDLVLAAQAFHWFDPPAARAEFARILKPAGHIVLVWNERKLDATPFLRAYEALLHAYATDYAAVRHENVDAPRLAAFFGPAGYTKHEFPNAQHFDYAGLEGRLMSSSYAPGPQDARHGPMLNELRAIFDAHAVHGQVEFEYVTRAYLGRAA